MNARTVHAAYYVAHSAKSLLWTAGDMIAIYALVGLYGRDPMMAGWLFLFGLTVNAGADVAVGTWLDRCPGHAARLAAAGLAVAALAFPLTVLAAPLGWGALLAATIVFRLAYAAYDVPHNALLSRLAEDFRATTRLSRGRTLATGAAAAIVGLGVHRFGDAAGLPWLLGALAAAALLGGLALVPLLICLPAPPAQPEVAAGAGLPWRFLGGSVVGVVALGGLAKGMMHLPPIVPQPGAGTILILLTAGRTVTALLPVPIGEPRRGLFFLAGLYLVAMLAGPLLLGGGGVVLPLALGGLLGATNLLGWALLPLMAKNARGFALYTMASKLALGLGGLAMTAALGDRSTFAPAGLTALAVGAGVGCLFAAVLLMPSRLTAAAPPGARGG